MILQNWPHLFRRWEKFNGLFSGPMIRLGCEKRWKELLFYSVLLYWGALPFDMIRLAICFDSKSAIRFLCRVELLSCRGRFELISSRALRHFGWLRRRYALIMNLSRCWKVAKRRNLLCRRQNLWWPSSIGESPLSDKPPYLVTCRRRRPSKVRCQFGCAVEIPRSSYCFFPVVNNDSSLLRSSSVGSKPVRY